MPSLRRFWAIPSVLLGVTVAATLAASATGLLEPRPPAVSRTEAAEIAHRHVAGEAQPGRWEVSEVYYNDRPGSLIDDSGRRRAISTSGYCVYPPPRSWLPDGLSRALPESLSGFSSCGTRFRPEWIVHITADAMDPTAMGVWVKLDAATGRVLAIGWFAADPFRTGV